MDPIIERIPDVLKEEAEALFGKSSAGAAWAIIEFNKLIIDTIKDEVAVVKPQMAYYEIYGENGIRAFWETVSYAQQNGLLVIADAKRGDIDFTAEAYAEAFFGNELNEWITPSRSVNALTVNPYMGRDTLEPFLKKDTGVFILVKTSNPFSGDYQDQELVDGMALSEKIGGHIHELSKDYIGKFGYSSVGAVIGATYSATMKVFREIMPKSIFLVPGYGTQGASGADITNAFNHDGFGALISASRSIIYTYEETNTPNREQVSEAILHATRKMNADINSSLGREGKLKWVML